MNARSSCSQENDPLRHKSNTASFAMQITDSLSHYAVALKGETARTNRSQCKVKGHQAYVALINNANECFQGDKLKRNSVK